MKLALPLHVVFLRLLAPASPPLHRAFPRSPTTCPRSLGGGSPVPRRELWLGAGSSGSPPAALGMLRGGRGGRFASQALALGGRRARGCSWSSGAWSWSCRSFPPTPPSSRAAAGAGAEAARGGQPAPEPAEPCPEPGARSPGPRAGQPPGRSLAGWDACRALALPGHEPG